MLKPLTMVSYHLSMVSYRKVVRVSMNSKLITNHNPNIQIIVSAKPT